MVGVTEENARDLGATAMVKPNPSPIIWNNLILK